MVFNFLPDLFKKKVCKYLLERYLGQFMEEGIRVEQLTVDFSKGTGTINDVKLSTEKLNELCESQGWTMEVISGHIGSLSINVPWSSLMSEDSYIEVNNLYLCLRPKERITDGTSVLESMWSSMSSSMQLAKECFSNDNSFGGASSSNSNYNNSYNNNNNNNQPSSPSHQQSTMEGIERFAQTIDSVLNRITAKLNDTEIRIEHLFDNTDNTDRGIAIIIKVDTLDYKNEAGSDPPDKVGTSSDENFDERQQNAFFLSSYATHNISIEGITFYTEEFRISNGVHKESSSDSLISSAQFFSTVGSFSATESSYVSEEQESRPQSDVEQPEEMDDYLVYRTEPIMIASLLNRHEIRVKMKQTDNVQGVKVQLEVTFGAFNIFMTPRQLHMLIEFLNVFLDNNSNSKISTETSQMADDPEILNGSDVANSMTTADHELQQYLKKEFNPMMENLTLHQDHWHSNKFPVAAAQTATSVPSQRDISPSSSPGSMCSSFTSLSTQNTSRARKRGTIDADPNADISQINIRLSWLSFILLHEDILTECLAVNKPPLSDESVTTLRLLAEDFFLSIKTLNLDLDAKDLKNIENILDQSFRNNHLRLILAPIIVEGEEQRNLNGNVLRLTISSAQAALREILKDNSISLLDFKEAPVGIPKYPDLTIGVKQITQQLRLRNKKKLTEPKTELSVSLSPCNCELDITIIDRLNSIINNESFSSIVSSQTSNKTPMKQSNQQNHQQKSNQIPEPNLDIKIDSKLIDVKFRFPIPDLRPIEERLPWWKQNVYKDYLLIKLSNMQILLNAPVRYDITASGIDVYYYENSSIPGIHMAKVSSTGHEVTNYGKAYTESPRIVIEIPTDNVIRSNLQSNLEKSPVYDSSGISIGKRNERATPFSSKRVCRESDTPHARQNTEYTEAEYIFLPGDKTELQDFMDESMKSSKIQVNFFLPLVSLQLNSKHLYEVIYNRINSDLLLWQPSVFKMTKKSPGNVECNISSSSTIKLNKSELDKTLLNASMTDSLYVPFSMCRSGINYESSNATSESDADSSDNIYYSVYDKDRPHRRSVNHQKLNISALTLRLHIGEGMLTMYAPVRDSQNHVIPGQLGEFSIKIGSTVLLFVNGYNNNDNLSYLCFQSVSAELYHLGLIPVPTTNPPLRLIDYTLPYHLQSTFYPLQKNVTIKVPKCSENREMISFSVQIKICPDQHLKRIRVAGGIQQGTLRQHFSLPEHYWLIQLIDMFDVVDYPVLGYKPFDVITEMFMHLWDCAIDYRPKYLPFRTIITLGSFMVSSNVTLDSSGCTLRFIAEECSLSVAPQKVVPHGTDTNTTMKKYQLRNCDKITALPSSELVCLIELGLFEVSLILNEKATSESPKLDLRSSINDFNIHTCSDSASALAELLVYIANESDFAKIDESTHETIYHSDDEDALLHMKPNTHTVPEITESQQLRVNSLMEDAMEESVYVDQGELLKSKTDYETSETNNDGVEIFFFPDESDVDTEVGTALDSNTSTPILARSKSLSEAIDLNLNKLEKRSSSSSLKFDELSNKSTVVYDSDSVNTDIHELLNFETSMMGTPCKIVVESVPQVAIELGDANRMKPSTSHSIPNKNISSDTDEDFCIIANEEKPKFDSEVKTDGKSIRIIDNHFSAPIGKPDLLVAPPGFPTAIMRYTLCEMTLIWHIYGGNDFPKEPITTKEKTTTSTTTPATSGQMSGTYKMGVSYSKATSTVTFDHPKKKPNSKKHNGGGINRKLDVLMEFRLNKLRFSHEMYPSNTKQASRQVLLITEYELRDCLKVSDMNKFLCKANRSRRSSQPMLAIKALHLRPDPTLTTQECCLRISMLPLRLHVDQDSLLFLVDFFNDISNASNKDQLDDNDLKRRSSLQQHHQPPPPIMMVDDVPSVTEELQTRKIVNENLMKLIEDDVNVEKQLPEFPVTSENVPIYFRTVVFGPEVPIRFDYEGKHLEMSRGPLAGLIMGLGRLNCSELKLKRIEHKLGILGVDRLVNFLIKEWLQDIKNNQLQSILGGVGPIRTFIELFQGIRDLFWLPIEQYRKDGQIVRGLQLGAQSFSTRTVLAALDITTRIIYLLQITAETAYDMVSPGPSLKRLGASRREKRKRTHPPQDIREGVVTAFNIVKEGVGDTANTLVETVKAQREQKGFPGAVGAVVRQLPPTIVCPVVIAAQATTNVLGGISNQLIPDAKLDARDKFKDEYF